MSDDQEPGTIRRLCDSKEACRILACGPTHLWKLAREGQITPIRLRPKMTRYCLAELNDLADRLIAGAKAESAERLRQRTQQADIRAAA